ncbi:hypothetical protein BCR33DRAFT_741746 [Rhizoclosmatium globosum]|uniref:Vps41 beta-propeller domain-containing protein n=1 Tax=Rhizoclosmatium globosum TaxID=329046 RepID=A0A1Y2BU11_9FUNG|nr:hypothetical protein BCR33DRAFT_741746 [Rhizoclosmatium globosum]|eukprot:ORY38239.1 hypothetical protein BCR33DRAFT_741746 [Rhizoclosmatium globosum]
MNSDLATTSVPSSSESESENDGAPSKREPIEPTEDEDELDDASSDEDDDDDDESDEEPMLKYQRLSGTLAETLKKDAVSTMAVSDRFLALGTHWGVVHILDLSGNNVKRFECHSATINDICIDTAGEFVASASDDGKVIINSLYTHESPMFKHRRPIKCVALEPDYSRKQSRNHVSGGTGEELVMTGKGCGEGAVWAVQWRNNFIAWANDAGVKVYDVTTSQKFAYIDRPVGSPRADLYRCNLCWKDDETLMIGWADSVKIGVVKERAKADVIVGTTGVAVGLPAKYIEIVCEFRTDFIVSGIAPLRGQIVLLSFILNEGEDHRSVDVLPSPGSNAPQKLLSNPPEIHVVDMNGEHVANDVLSLFGYEHYRANDYRLAFLPSLTLPTDTTFYIVSPKDIVVAKPRDLDDHIEFLVSRSRYEEALAAVESATIHKKEADGSIYQGKMGVADVLAIGLKYLGSLMDDGNYDLAAQSTPKILRTDAKLWEQWTYTFIGVNKLSILLPFIPFSEIQMNKACYEMILTRFLDSDEKALHDEDVKGSRMWTGKEEGFGTGSVLVSEDVRVLRRAGLGEGVRLLVEHTDRAPVKNIVEILRDSRKFMHIYLDALFRYDEHEGILYHTAQVELYADFDPTRLLDFLRSSAMYKTQTAYELCEIRDLVPEMVYLLGKMGNNRKALVLVIERLGDVKQAIEFCKEQNDEQLWDDLIKYSMDKPPFIIGLLENLGSHVDPIKVIRNIPEGLPIPQLQSSLITIMTDYGIQMSLREGCAKILVSDAVKLMESLYYSQKNGIIMKGMESESSTSSKRFFTDSDLRCHVCENKFSIEGKQ